MKTTYALSFSLFLCFLPLFSHATSSTSITRGQVIGDGDTVVSASLNFELGFFSFKNSSHRYVGIWYRDIPGPSVIWVANRGNPIRDRKGVITIGSDGNLVITDGEKSQVWSSNATIPDLNSQIHAILRDDGNLVISSTRNNNRELWQSFQHPTDTFVPGMIVPVNATMGELRSFISWKSSSDPSLGNYTMGVDPRASPQIVIWERGGKRRWRSGYWDGRIFTGVSNMTGSYLHGFRLNEDDNQGRYLTYSPFNSSDKVKFQIGWDGKERMLLWNEGQKEWVTNQTEPFNDCEMYNKCGSFGVCGVSDSPICSCIEGFEPKDSNEWNSGNWSGGCRRKTPLKDEMNASVVTEKHIGDDGFFMLESMKLPDFANLVVDGGGSGMGTTNEVCETYCLPNSSCTAYANLIGIGCLTWYGELLVDIQKFDNGGGNTLFIRLADSDLGKTSTRTKVVIILAVVVGVICLGFCVWLVWIFKGKHKASIWKKGNIPMFDASQSREFSGLTDLSFEGSLVSGPELPFFNFNCIAQATNNFSEENKLGQGGFGPVYKGKLPGGEEIAVKRLSKLSCQGLEEFKNEMLLIAKLQHRNLVRLLGCSVLEEEKLLIYEYMPNRSLDCYLFDPAGQKQLDWRKRFEIIEGIARGLLYLHRDSRLRIIHRDLKASNVLLDENMNPKISDFGLARIFGGNENEANTNRVVGTYGYMSPEYAMEGLFSIKSDVYSFGVLLLEIISGRKNVSFRSQEDPSLIAHAWDVWNDEKALELVDPSIRDSIPLNKAMRWIQIGMLCVQDSAAYRPTMSSVVLMLESEITSLPLPKQPMLSALRSSRDTDFLTQGLDASSSDLTVTVSDGR